jgi:hypothetical protein
MFDWRRQRSVRAIHDVFYISGKWVRGMAELAKPLIQVAVRSALAVIEAHQAAA